ncbi:MAG: hypothetical protein ABIH38_04465 [Patescibacteria group bacterium]
MAKLNTVFKIMGLGLLLFIPMLIFDLIVSTVANSYEPIDYWWVNVIRAIVIAFFAWLFSRLLHVTSAKQALTYGIVWAIIILAIHLILIIPNGVEAIFGHWTVGLLFIGIAIGPLFGKNTGKKLIIDK